MTVEMLQTLSLVGYILSGVFLLLAVALFFILEIPKVVGDVTGATAKKAIENIRQQNAESGDKAYKPSPVKAARGKLTEKILPSGSLPPQTSGVGVSVGTEKISTQQIYQPEHPETTVLENASGETMVLENTESNKQQQTNGQTSVLSNSNAFSVDVEIDFTESKEIID